MKRLPIAAAVLLAGCAQTPKMVMEEGRQSEHRLAKPPTDAAWCVARNVENFRPSGLHPGFTSSVRPLARGAEVVAQLRAADASAIAVIHLIPEGSGSAAKVWLSGYSEWVRAFLEGC